MHFYMEDGKPSLVPDESGHLRGQGQRQPLWSPALEEPLSSASPCALAWQQDSSVLRGRTGTERSGSAPGTYTLTSDCRSVPCLRPIFPL